MRAKSQTCRKELLEARARWMRREPTLTESVLWERLRGKRLGVVFRRQVVIGRYIVDFCAPAVRLVVEVDGGYHKLRASLDAKRDRALVRAGYRVVRVSDREVFTDIEAVVWVVSSAIETR